MNLINSLDNMWYVIAILGISVLVCIFIINNLLNQISTLEKFIDSEDKKKNQKRVDFDKYYEYMLKLFSETLLELKRVDRNGAFSSDDEVGFAFRIILNAIEITKEKLSALQNPEEDKKPED